VSSGKSTHPCTCYSILVNYLKHAVHHVDLEPIRKGLLL
jgi:hypothetical protein